VCSETSISSEKIKRSLPYVRSLPGAMSPFFWLPACIPSVTPHISDRTIGQLQQSTVMCAEGTGCGLAWVTFEDDVMSSCSFHHNWLLILLFRLVKDKP
jgi:hypothetical protein